MGMVILTILKMIGIILLVALGLILLLLLLVLFVPIRYRIDASKDAEGEQQLHALIRVTWLLHLLNIRFLYPEEAYLRVRIACFTLFRSDRPSKVTASAEKKAESDPKVKKKVKASKASKEEKSKEGSENDFENEPENKTADAAHTETNSKSAKERDEEKEAEESTSKWGLLREKIIWCIQRLWELLKNIRYTIQSIYDKIRNIIHDIRYYYKIFRSDLFHRTWEKCSKEALRLLKSIAPRKVKGYLHIGMEDPATTGQILGCYGMLYPLIGGHIDVIPDFDQIILEGSLKIRGHITLFQAVRTACIIYFNKDLRKLIRLLKREVA